MHRRVLTFISGIAILVAHWHCAVGHGAAPHVCQSGQAENIAVFSPESNPFGPASNDSHGCENHFGCICKGATLGNLFSWVDSSNFQFLPQLSALTEFRIAPRQLPVGDIPFWHSNRPFSALQICARFQSFQL